VLDHQPRAELEERLTVTVVQLVEDRSARGCGEGVEDVRHDRTIGKSVLACQGCGAARIPGRSIGYLPADPVSVKEPEIPRSRSERPMLAMARRSAIAGLLRAAGAITVTEVESQFGISPMTARRDLMELERQGVARRTHGGAVLPSISAQEDSFAARVEVATEAKAGLAAEAVTMLSPRETVFLDSSSTAYFLARRIVELGLGVTVITNSLPVMEAISARETPNVKLVGIGGTLRPLTRSFVGPYAVHTVQGHFADRLFFSVKGVTRDGVLTDADELEAEVKRAMIMQAEESVLLLDDSKLGARGQNAIARVNEVSSVLAHGAPASALEPLRSTGIKLKVVGGT
jgi:DeoR/GlpR family transcriptional regulator of sugar metabolism